MPVPVRPAYPIFFSYAHARGGGFGPDPNLAFHQFFDDICGRLYHLTPYSVDVAFADTSMRVGNVFPDVLFERLAQFQVFVPLISLEYFNKEWCGKEWAAYEKRCGKLSPYPPIVPILWNSLDVLDARLPKWFTERHLFDDSTQNPLYRQHGLYGLQSRYPEKYRETVYDLAHYISRVAGSAHLPEGDPQELSKLPPWFGEPS